MISMVFDPRSESPCSILKLQSKVMVATILPGKVIYYWLFEKKDVGICLSLYIYLYYKYIQFSALFELFQTSMKCREEVLTH